VSKSDFHIIREQLPGDEVVPMAPPSPGNLGVDVAGTKVVAGACSGPVRIEPRDASGKPVGTKESVMIALAATPPSAIFYSDADCSKPTTSIPLEPGINVAEFYFRATLGGSLRISASAAAEAKIDLSEGDQAYVVEPGPALTVGFPEPSAVSAVNACSKAVSVQSRDAFGNPASVLLPTPVHLATEPAEGVSFHADPGCAGPAISSVEIPAKENIARFYFKGLSAHSGVITAGLGLARAKQELLILPASPAPRP
jgi:hypothetical protein